MAQISGYWKIIKPKTRKELYNPEQFSGELNSGYSSSNSSGYTSLPSFNNDTADWYSKVMKGPSTRLNSYVQYDQMDSDVDINRGLDMIAEEMTANDEKTNLPFLINWLKEDNQDISDATVVTIRSALRAWTELQDIQKRKFNIARQLSKFGDVFFWKVSDTKKWKYIDPSRVQAIEVDDEDRPLFYYVSANSVLMQDTYETASGAFNNVKSNEMLKIPASAMIHFSNCDDMADTAPFGLSLLRPIFRVYRQYTMLEDAVVIYRIVRAPERRVFYIDVGNMNPNQVKRYLENIKNEMRQKRTPGVGSGGKEMVDGQYDVTSIQEDFFFPVTAGGKGSRVETIPGGAEDFGTNLLKQFQDKMFRGLRIPSSYVAGTSGNEGNDQQYNDGKVGVAYFEELRFANFIKRQQKYLNKIFDIQFKIYLQVCGVVFNDEVFQIVLPDPENFALYKQSAVDTDLINNFNSVKENSKYLAIRFILKRYLGLTDDEIQMNEVMLKEEQGIKDTDKLSPLQQMYDPAVFDNRKPIIKKDDKSSDEAGDGASDEGFGDMGDLGGGDSMPEDGVGDVSEPAPEAAPEPAPDEPPKEK